jgi:glutaredoxin
MKQIKPPKKRRRCLKCNRSFWSVGSWNRLCSRCNAANRTLREGRSVAPRWNGESMARTGGRHLRAGSAEEPRIEVITRPRCGGCQELKARLSEAGLSFTEYDAETPDGLAVWAWYDAPEQLPALALDGHLLPGSGNPERLFEALTKGKRR